MLANNNCPPRFTTGTIQALCAGSHLLIPTILDQPSAEAVTAFCEEIEGLKNGKVCPYLKYVGIVGTKVSANVDQIAERYPDEFEYWQTRDGGFAPPEQ